MKTSPSQSAANLARTLSEFLNTMAIFAAPRVYAKLTEGMRRERVLETITRFIEAGENVKEEPFAGMRVEAIEMRALFERWDPELSLPRELIEKARVCITHMGVPTPPGGWDDFEGPAE